VVTILHISDLHRDPTSLLRNGPLLQSLLNDRDRYLREGRSQPDIVIVSGDLIHGVPANTANADSLLQEQYFEAEEFLHQLAEDMLGGDHHRIVIVPGNHDVSWPTVMSSLEPVTITSDSARSEYARALVQVETDVRWSWAASQFYRIADRPLYEARLKHFGEFVERFYADGVRSSAAPAARTPHRLNEIDDALHKRR
jgi:predicted MPP superfamily phosphohydrolase